MAIVRHQRLLEPAGVEQRSQQVPVCWTGRRQSSQQESGRDLESGCWSGALNCRSVCPCSQLRGRDVVRTAYFFLVGQQSWVWQHKGVIRPHCKQMRNSEEKGELETSGVTEPNQKSLYAGQGAESPLLKEVLEQARKGKWG